MDELIAGSNGTVDAESIFDMGPHLRTLAQAIKKAGASVILVHHVNRRGDKFQPMELEDVAYAGIAEFARQWLFLKRKEAYQHDGIHSIWLSVGGSGGQGGLWEMQVQEGSNADPGGRKWDVTLLSSADRKNEASAAAEQRREKKSEAYRVKLEKDGIDVLKAVDPVVRDTKQAGAIKKQLEKPTGFKLQETE